MAAPAGLPGLAPGAERVVVDQRSAPWTSVARLNIPGVARCAAVIVSPRLALTAAHCVVSRRLGHVAPPSAIHVLTGYAGGAYARQTVAIGVRVAPGFDLLRPDETRGADVALIALPAAMADGDLPLADARRGDAVMVGGYNQDRAEVLTADVACRATGYGVDGEGRPLLLHDCAATRGTSGGPVLVRSADGWALAGLQVAAFDDRAGGVAIPASTLHALLIQGRM